MSRRAINDFASVMYGLVIGSGRTPDTPTVETIACWLNLKVPTVYAKLEGRLGFTVEEFVIMYRHARGLFRAALDYIAHECDAYLRVISVEGALPTDGTFRDEKDDLAILSGRLTDHINRSLADGRMSQHEKRGASEYLNRLRETIDRYQREVEDFNGRRIPVDGAGA
jgi:hypothetical protein